MNRIARFAVFATTLMSLLGVMSSMAGAVTWNNDGDTTFTATGSPGTLASTGALMTASQFDVKGVTTAGLTGVNAPIMHLTVLCTGCVLSAQSVGLECGVTFTAASQTTVAPRVTTGVADATCGVYLAGIKTCHLAGTLQASYTNPTAPSTFGKLTTATGGALRSSNGASNCPLGSNDLVHTSPITFTISSATGGPSPNVGPSITAV